MMRSIVAWLMMVGVALAQLYSQNEIADKSRTRQSEWAERDECGDEEGRLDAWTKGSFRRDEFGLFDDVEGARKAGIISDYEARRMDKTKWEMNKAIATNKKKARLIERVRASISRASEMRAIDDMRKKQAAGNPNAIGYSGKPVSAPPPPVPNQVGPARVSGASAGDDLARKIREARLEAAVSMRRAQAYFTTGGSNTSREKAMQAAADAAEARVREEAEAARASR